MNIDYVNRHIGVQNGLHDYIFPPMQMASEPTIT